MLFLFRSTISYNCNDYSYCVVHTCRDRRPVTIPHPLRDLPANQHEHGCSAEKQSGYSNNLPCSHKLTWVGNHRQVKRQTSCSEVLNAITFLNIILKILFYHYMCYMFVELKYERKIFLSSVWIQDTKQPPVPTTYSGFFQPILRNDRVFPCYSPITQGHIQICPELMNFHSYHPQTWWTTMMKLNYNG